MRHKIQALKKIEKFLTRRIPAAIQIGGIDVSPKVLIIVGTIATFITIGAIVYYFKQYQEQKIISSFATFFNELNKINAVGN